MAERALAGSVMTIRKGQTVLSTECSACHAVMRNPTAAARHAQRKGKGHYARAAAAQNEGVNPTLPPENGGTFRVAYPVSDSVVCSPTCLDRGDPSPITPCLCNCHYQGPTARQMLKEASNADPE
jgi:hypothetical protein